MKMKNKILGILIILINLAPLFAKEDILIKSDAVADLEGYDFVSNFEITSDSGRFKNSDLKILEPNEKEKIRLRENEASLMDKASETE